MQALRRVAARRPRTGRTPAPSESTASVASAGSTISSTSGSDAGACPNIAEGVKDWGIHTVRRKSASPIVDVAPYDNLLEEQDGHETPATDSISDAGVTSHGGDSQDMSHAHTHVVTVRTEAVPRVTVGSVLVGSELQTYPRSAWSGAEVDVMDRSGAALARGQALMPGELICGARCGEGVDSCMHSSPCVLITTMLPH